MNLRFQFSWVILPRSGTAKSYGNSMFNFLRNFSKVAAPFYILTSGV